MENGYGGPVWHASVAWQTPRGIRPTLLLNREEKKAMWRVAEHVLSGVGDRAAGEWRERIERSLHMKRRLSVAEWGDRPWGMDYRGTSEGWSRLNAIAIHLPGQFHEPLMAELIR